jgi:hypothetical protein
VPPPALSAPQRSTAEEKSMATCGAYLFVCTLSTKQCSVALNPARRPCGVTEEDESWGRGCLGFHDVKGCLTFRLRDSSGGVFPFISQRCLFVIQTNKQARSGSAETFWTQRFLRTASAHHRNLYPAGPAHRRIFLRSRWDILGFHRERKFTARRP